LASLCIPLLTMINNEIILLAQALDKFGKSVFEVEKSRNMLVRRYSVHPIMRTLK